MSPGSATSGCCSATTPRSSAPTTGSPSPRMVFFAIWAAYLIQRLWWFQRMAPAVRYAIPTAIIAYNINEILEKWGKMTEIWVQPQKYAMEIRPGAGCTDRGGRTGDPEPGAAHRRQQGIDRPSGKPSLRRPAPELISASRVSFCLDAHGQPDQIVGDAHRAPLFGWHARVTHGGRLPGKTLHGTEAFGNREQPQPVEELADCSLTRHKSRSRPRHQRQLICCLSQARCPG
jgi:hypothetical protein